MQRAGTRLALEMPPIGELNSISAAGSVVDEVGYGRASLLIDTFHFSRGRSTWEELESFPLEALGYVQFDDALAPESDDVMHETMDRRAMPGDGELELERFVTTLTGRGWSGLVSVEVLSEELRQLDITTFARRAYQSTASYWPPCRARSAGLPVRRPALCGGSEALCRVLGGRRHLAHGLTEANGVDARQMPRSNGDLLDRPSRQRGGRHQPVGEGPGFVHQPFVGDDPAGQTDLVGPRRRRSARQ